VQRHPLPPRQGCQALHRVERKVAEIERFATEGDAVGIGARQDEEKEQLVGGKSLAEIAQERNIATPTLREAMLAASRAELDQAVRDGVISQATADTRYDEITRMVDELIAQGIGPR
jgi:hypothetical protein